MALTSTVYNFDIEISDVDRDVYVTRSIAVACHPSESHAFLVTRVLAYCLEYRDDLEFTRGLSESDEPALWARDLTGALQAWIEVGNPSGERLHRARKACPHVAVYATRDLRGQLENYRKENIYRADTIEIIFTSQEFLAALQAGLSRRNSWALSRSDGVLYLRAGPQEAHVTLTRASLSEA